MKNIVHFLTPILVTITIFLLAQIGGRIDRIDTRIDRMDLKLDIVDLHFTNHLSNHKDLEVMLEKRLTCIETKLNGYK